MATTEEIDDYKRSEYLKLGFTEYEAYQLVRLGTALSVAEVRKAINAGCAVKTAYRIFAP